MTTTAISGTLSPMRLDNIDRQTGCLMNDHPQIEIVTDDQRGRGRKRRPPDWQERTAEAITDGAEKWLGDRHKWLRFISGILRNLGSGFVLLGLFQLLSPLWLFALWPIAVGTGWYVSGALIGLAIDVEENTRATRDFLQEIIEREAKRG